jgi:hypothetical protein
MMEKDKRREKRKQEEQEVVVEVLEMSSSRNRSKAEKFTAVTENLSLNGVRIKCPRYYPVNTVLKIKLPLLKRNPVFLRGKIRWVENIKKEKNFGIGIEFIDTLPAEFITLMEHLYGASKTS